MKFVLPLAGPRNPQHWSVSGATNWNYGRKIFYLFNIEGDCEALLESCITALTHARYIYCTEMVSTENTPLTSIFDILWPICSLGWNNFLHFVYFLFILDMIILLMTLLPLLSCAVVVNKLHSVYLICMQTSNMDQSLPPSPIME